MVITILMFLIPIKHISTFLGISKGLQNILYSLSYPFAYPLHCLFLQSSTSFSEHGRLHAVKVLCFLDNGLGIAYTYPDAFSCSNFVITTLINSGFVPNITKSIWIPCQHIIWLGIEVDTNTNILSITSSRITRISAWELSELAGKIISAKFIIGNITHLKTQNIYKIIESRPSWDNKFNLSLHHKAVEDIIFWKNKIKTSHKRFIKEHKIPPSLVYSDASNSGLASVYKEKGKPNSCYKSFLDQEKSQNSTWRELEVIQFSLDSSKNKFENKAIFWYTDNYACSLILSKGSNKPTLHDLALDIHKISSAHNIDLNVCWIPMEESKEADRLSKHVDYDDWFTTKDLVKMLTNKWGKISIDRFASHTNTKTQRFNCKYNMLRLWRSKRILSRLVKKKQFTCTPSMFNSRDNQAFYVIKIFSKGNAGVSKTSFLQNFGHCYLKWREGFRVSLRTYLLLRNVPKYIKFGNYKKSLIGSEQFHSSSIAFQLIR